MQTIENKSLEMKMNLPLSRRNKETETEIENVLPVVGWQTTLRGSAHDLDLVLLYRVNNNY
jgi:hypothetical protein